MGGDGIKVSGNGGTARPYVVSFDNTNGAVCEQIVDCIGQQVGPGLAYDDQTNTIRVKLSADPGCRGSMRFGSDGGLCADSDTDPTDLGGVTVDGALQTEHWAIGFRGNGRLLSPEAQEKSYEDAVSNRLIATHIPIRTLQDGTGVACGLDNMAYYTIDNHKDPLANVNRMIWDTAKIFIGPGPSGIIDNVGTDAGFFNFGEPAIIGGPLVSRILSKIAKRIVIFLDMMDARSGIPTLDLVNKYGIHDSVVALGRPVDAPYTADLFLQAGIKHVGIILTDPADLATWTPEAVVAAGYNWVVLGSTTTSAVIATYVAAGLEVVLFVMQIRQYQRKANQALGVRGVFSDDPIYYSGDVARYRSDVDRYVWKRVHYGVFSTYTDQGGIANSRGYYKSNEDGWWIASTVNETTFPIWNYFLLGYVCPIDTASYRIDFQVQFDTLPSSPYASLGIAFGYPEDTSDIKNHVEARFRKNGQMVMELRDPAGTAVFSTYKQYTVPVAGRWYAFSVDVSPSAVKFISGDNKVVVEPPAANKAATVTQATTGPYVNLLKYASGDKSTFVGGFKTIKVTRRSVTATATTLSSSPSEHSSTDDAPDFGTNAGDAGIASSTGNNTIESEEG